MLSDDKAQRLFEYISQVYSIDLEVDRHISKYSPVWWLADLIPSAQCKIKQFHLGNNIEGGNEVPGENAWLSVTKRSYDSPPPLPVILNGWIEVSQDPAKSPSPKPSIIKRVLFEEDEERLTAFNEYIKQWEELKASDTEESLAPPEVLSGWIDVTQPEDQPPLYISEREIGEYFKDDENRVSALNQYVATQWKPWSERVLPLFKANILYDQLFSLHQRLTVEGDRIEIVWGHLFLSWNHHANTADNVYYPLVLTLVNLSFDPMKREITLSPSQIIPTKVDIDCLLNLDYPLKDELTNSVRRFNNAESPPDPWNHNQTKSFAATITGYLSTEPADKTNLYSDEAVARPTPVSIPTIYNAPLFFVRERSRRLWVDDAKKVAESIYSGSEVPPYIRSLVANPHMANELPNPDDYIDTVNIDEDDGEELLPLEYNDQQKEIAEKLKKHYGVLVQGPPGTGKSHTIANVISSLLARGKRVLVTSQTENALKVLRNHIPAEIRSLCVSHVGNDTEAKRQLAEAVNAIGQRLGERDSQTVEQKIKNIRRELRSIREEQAELRNQIQGWVKLDSETLSINGTSINAFHAAKECSESKADHSWFPDKISPETEPPLNNQELRELCALLKDISPDDRISCLQYLPATSQLPAPEEFSKKIAELNSFHAFAAETESQRLDWNRLNTVQADEISKAVNALEEALLSLQGLQQPWQLKILDLMISEDSQNTYWHEFLKKCTSYRDAAWNALQSKQGYQVSIEALPTEIDKSAVLEELRRTIEAGRNPAHLFTRLGLSKSAKLFFDSVKVDGRSLASLEQINLIKACLTYEECLKKIKTLWTQTIKAVNGSNIDFAAAMPLENIDVQIKNVRSVVAWKDNWHERIKKHLESLGCRERTFHKQASLAECLKALRGQLAALEESRLRNWMEGYQNYLNKEAGKETAHIVWKQLAEAVKYANTDGYKEIYDELNRILNLRSKVQKLESLVGRLKSVAPDWYSEIEKEAVKVGSEAVNKDWAEAWRWMRLNEWLKNLHGRESVESLQSHLERARKKEHSLTVQLVAALTWQQQIACVKDHHYRALVAWADAMRHYGKGTGQQAPHWLSVAAKAMTDAVGAVPAWIMPLHRVIQSFPAKPGIFDVVIVDEASQCDLRALSVLYRAKKVLVVGDPEQISPSNVGIEREKVLALERQYLSDIPFSSTFTVENSLYEITKAIPRINRTLLTEHFRCVPQIIEFNNRLCPSYEGKLEPLRQPNPQERLEPAINTVFVKNGFKNNNDINEPEAEALVEMLVKCCQDEKYATGGKNDRKRTMGVISLLGEKQAKYIYDLIAKRLDETEREERRIICGDAYSFQGDERDVMFLSLVIATNAQFTALTKDSDRQRFNVATSRARDQVYLFHSVGLESMRNPQCMRYQLLNWYLKPPSIIEMEAGIERLKDVADSHFEIAVGEKIIHRGFKVIPQFRPFPSDKGYRIDLVIQGDKNRVAVECDGDRWHGPERWEYDQRREAQLRRAGWKFWRISGSAFYRDKEKSLEGLWKFLDEEEVRPLIGTL